MPFKDPNKQKEYGRNHYLQNKTSYLESNRKRRAALKEYVRKLKEKEPCKDCGVNYPYFVMDFDHLENKEALVKVFANNNNRTGLLNEIKKCEIVCSNCHRIRTHTRLSNS